MENGGNQKALDYFRKNGAVPNNTRNIDYKSPVVQRYKQELTKIVESQLALLQPNKQSSVAINNTTNKANASNSNQVIQNKEEKKQENTEQDKKSEPFFNNLVGNQKVVTNNKVTFNKDTTQSKAGGKGIKAKKIDDFDFDNLVLEDDVNISSNNKKEGQADIMQQNQFKLYEEEEQNQPKTV